MNGKTGYKKAMELLMENEREAVRKFERLRKQVERDERRFRRKHIFYV